MCTRSQKSSNQIAVDAGYSVLIGSWSNMEIFMKKQKTKKIWTKKAMFSWSINWHFLYHEYLPLWNPDSHKKTSYYDTFCYILQKERDLELAARIGQTLLTKNQELVDKNENLEEQLSSVVDKVQSYLL